jgi:hypothetical protein
MALLFCRGGVGDSLKVRGDGREGRARTSHEEGGVLVLHGESVGSACFLARAEDERAVSSGAARDRLARTSTRYRRRVLFSTLRCIPLISHVSELIFQSVFFPLRILRTEYTVFASSDPPHAPATGIGHCHETEEAPSPRLHCNPAPREAPWLVRSRPRASPPEARPPANSSPPRRRASPRPPPAA